MYGKPRKSDLAEPLGTFSYFNFLTISQCWCRTGEREGSSQFIHHARGRIGAASLSTESGTCLFTLCFFEYDDRLGVILSFQKQILTWCQKISHQFSQQVRRFLRGSGVPRTGDVAGRAVGRGWRDTGTVELSLNIQGPVAHMTPSEGLRRGPNHVLTWWCVFVIFANIRYFWILSLKEGTQNCIGFRPRPAPGGRVLKNTRQGDWVLVMALPWPTWAEQPLPCFPHRE